MDDVIFFKLKLVVTLADGHMDSVEELCPIGKDNSIEEFFSTIESIITHVVDEHKYLSAFLCSCSLCADLFVHK